MMNLKNTKIISAITMILIFAFSTIMVLPRATASIEIDSTIFITAVPNPIGVGQTLSVMWWLAIPPPGAAGPTGPRWQDFTITFEKPDGTQETRGPLTSDANGGAYISYQPNQVGTYTFWANFPGQWINTSSYQRWYKPATSDTHEVTVQEDPIPITPDNPLPNSYWERPINAKNREWYQISGNWLMAKYDKDAVSFEGSGNFAPYTTAPNTAHIVWTKPIAMGGLIGGEYGYGISYYSGLQYEPKFTPPIIINGILYYNTADPPKYGFQAVDLRTGEQLWYQNYSYALSFGQIYWYESPNQHGGIPYLWARQGSTWHMHDAFTGNYILSVSGVPSGYITIGPIGEILVYKVDNTRGWVSLWNSSKAINPGDNWQWRPDSNRGKTIDGSQAIEWNVTTPTVTGAGNSISWLDREAEIFVTHQSRQASNDVWPTFVDVAFSTKTGQMLWTANRTNIGDVRYPVYVIPYEGVYTLPYREEKQWIAWDMKTGQELWRTEPLEDDWSMYMVGGGFAYGVFYSAGFEGAVTAYNTLTGEFEWQFYSGDSGFDTPYLSWAFYGASVIADGKIFIPHNEHSPNVPLWHGERLHAIDAFTGEGVWNITGQFTGGRNGFAAIADGYLVTTNILDSQIYCFGKGLTETTVTTSPMVSVHGSSVLVQGSVIDKSPGANGAPAIADQYMTPYMEYLYMQQPFPSDITGVEAVSYTHLTLPTTPYV